MFCCKRKKERSVSSYLDILGQQNKYGGSQSEQKKLDIHNQLLEFVKANDIQNIKHLINEHNELLEIKYAHPFFKSIIPIARFCLSRQVHQETVQTLISLGFQINNAANRIEELMYFAGASGHVEKLKQVFEHINEKRPDMLNNTREGDTALMFLIKYGNATSETFPKCVQILVDANLDVNVPDYNNCAPITRIAYLYHTQAIKKQNINEKFLSNFKEVMRIILDKGGVDIDSHRWYEKTAREYINMHNLYNLKHWKHKTSPKYKNRKSELFSLVIAKNETRILNLKPISSYDVDDGENTLLQLACILKLEPVVKHFLKRGADPNRVTNRNRDTPLEMAAKRNHYNIFEVLLSWKTTCITQRIYNSFALNKGNKMKDKYFTALLYSKKLDVDFVCKNGNTPLHYAAMSSENQAVLQMLHQGASLVVKNKSGEKSIDYIDPRIMKRFLDECIESRATQNIYHKKSTISFNYHFLLKNERERVDNKDSFIEIEELEAVNSTKQLFNTETEVALAISRFSEKRNLLKHPVISSFLYVKWYKIKAFFWIIMVFHVWCYLNFLYFFYNSPKFTNAQLNGPFWLFLVSYIAYSCFVVTRIIVTKDELKMSFQMCMEVFLVCLVLITISVPVLTLRKHFSAFGIILSAFLLVFWAGYHPKMSSHVAMLQRVSYNFFRILMFYCILILAFGVSFYLLFNEYDFDTSENAKASNETVDDETLFVNPGRAIFKAFVMMTGEYETSVFKFTESSISSYIVFLMFVFVISLILMNLLTGVAVSDTETIQNEAETVGHIATIRFIRFIEMILQPSFMPKFALHRIVDPDSCFLVPNALSNYKLTIYPNLHGKVKCDPSSTLSNLRMSKWIVKNAMNIIIEREIKFKLLESETMGIADMKVLQKRIEEIAEKQRTYYKKFLENLEQITNNLNMITENFEIIAQ